MAAQQTQALLSYPSEAVEPRGLIFDIVSFLAWFLLAVAFDRNLLSGKVFQVGMFNQCF